jgi:dolichyl-diphosphooligosaccharide--protein glycosyltransferase
MKKKIWILIVLYLIALMVFTLWIRLLPLLNLGNSDIFGIVGTTDSLYILRQIEQTSANFPLYGWYDPMTYYPYGQVIGLGPVFVWICSGLCVITGALTRSEIVRTALLVPPVMAVLMIPVVFLLIRKIADLKTGLVGAGLITVIGGNYFFISLAGHFDHHMADVLFSTIFCLSYLYTVSYATDHPDALKKRGTAGMLVGLSLVSGITYSVGLLTTPAMIFFGLLIVVYTAVLFFYNFYHNRECEHLLVISFIIFACATGTLLLNGIRAPGTNLYEYSLGQPLAYLLALIGIVALYALVLAFRRNRKGVYPALVFCIGILGLLAVVLLIPELSTSLLSGYRIFFGFNPNAGLVQETRNYTLAYGWQSLGFGLVLAAGGYGITFWQSLKKYRPLLVFILVWTLLMALATWRQARHEYYLTVTIVILSSICMVWFFGRGWNALLARMKGGVHTAPPPPSSKNGSEVLHQSIPYVHIILGILVVGISMYFVLSSIDAEYRFASDQPEGVNTAWREALEWLRTGTPDPGVDYYRIYDRATFTYPDQSYGILTWWDNGNLITFFARRIPNANPFQSGVGESAQFFMADSEEAADIIADNGGIRYIVTDIRTTALYLGSIAKAYNASAGLIPYKEPFLIPAPGNVDQYKTVTFYKKPFFRTMLVRLHTFDGSMLQPAKVVDIEYNHPTASTRGLKVITSMRSVDAANRSTAMAPGTGQAGGGTRADTVSISYLLPVETVPALHHYRLVYESAGTLSGNSTDKYIKIFEYVPGARIPGEGVIGISLITNAGRQFEYRQASEQGEFIVPYSTLGNPYNVSAIGKYRIIGTDKEFDVSEDAIQKGLTIVSD